MARDKVHPLKMESPGSGGTQLDDFPTSLNPQEDYVDARGVLLQSGTGSNDEAVGVERVNSELQLWDSQAGTYTLSQLLSGSSGISEAQHKALRQLIHFIDDGPADGFASGSYKEILPSGNPFPTSEVWWESAAKLKKIVELTITRSAAKVPTEEEWKIYDTDGSTVLITLTDAITYVNNVFESTRTRTWV